MATVVGRQDADFAGVEKHRGLVSVGEGNRGFTAQKPGDNRVGMAEKGREARGVMQETPAEIITQTQVIRECFVITFHGGWYYNTWNNYFQPFTSVLSMLWF